MKKVLKNSAEKQKEKELVNLMNLAFPIDEGRLISITKLKELAFQIMILETDLKTDDEEYLKSQYGVKIKTLKNRLLKLKDKFLNDMIENGMTAYYIS